MTSPTGSDAAVRQKQRHWRANLCVTGLLLVLWFGVTFGVSYFARDLTFRIFGWPFSFWMAAQGALVVYCFIVAVYAWCMGRLDRVHGLEETRP